MRILHVVTSLRMGGAEKLISEITPILRDKGHFVDVLAFDGTDTFFKRVLEEKGIRVFSFGENCCVYNPLYIYKLIMLMKNYDIVHTHNTSPQFFAAIGSVFTDVKLVTTEHSTSNRRRDSKIYKFVDRWMYNKYNYVICISEMTQHNLENYIGNTKARILTIENGINVNQYMMSNSLNCELKDTNRFVITMVAGFRYQKDHETVIRAMRLLDKDKYEIWFVGDGDRRSEIEACIESNGVTENIRLWGFRSDIIPILKSSDVILQSSHIEGFGLAAVEGMAAGKPVVATDIPGLGQIVKGAGVLFNHQDEIGLASIIEKLATDHNYYVNVALACQKRALQFDICKMVNMYNDVYKSLF